MEPGSEDRTIAPLAFGKTLNYRNESVVGDIKYLWEPNRHLHFVTLAQAYHQSGEQRYLTDCGSSSNLVRPMPIPAGSELTSSLELAIRLINWSIAWQLIGGVALCLPG